MKIGIDAFQPEQAGRGRTWVPILLGMYAVGLICAGFFTADPAFGSPPGTPVVI